MSNEIETDVAIVGAGISGSILAAMLEKAGVDYRLVDPRLEYPDEFRCEKFNAHQIDLLKETGVAEDVFHNITPVKDVWMARFGRLVRKQHYPHYGFSYKTVVNSIRDSLGQADKFHQASVADISTSPDKQSITLNDGSTLKSRLVVMASGVNRKLQQQLGFEHKMLSKSHCLAIGFDIKPSAGSDFQFDTMTYWPEKASDQMSYLTFFKVGDGWRANMFGYWNIRDPWIQKLKLNSENTLHQLMPGLEKITGQFSVLEGMRIRPIDLYEWNGINADGIVAVGDALSSSCPGAGTGTTKAINDALLLGRTHIPNWLETSGMPASKISTFYCDENKLSIDQHSRSEAFKLRSLTLDHSLNWKLQRWGRFAYHFARGHLATN